MKKKIRKIAVLSCLCVSMIFIMAGCGTKNEKHYTDATKTVSATGKSYAPTSGAFTFDAKLSDIDSSDFCNVKDINYVRDTDGVDWIGGHTFEELQSGCTVTTSVEGLPPATVQIQNTNTNQLYAATLTSEGMTPGSDFVSSDIGFMVVYEGLEYEENYEAIFSGFVGLWNSDGELCAVGNLGYASGSNTLTYSFGTRHRLKYKNSADNDQQFEVYCASEGHENCLDKSPTLTISADPIYIGRTPIVHYGTKEERDILLNDFGQSIPDDFQLKDRDKNNVANNIPLSDGDYFIVVEEDGAEVEIPVTTEPFTMLFFELTGDLEGPVYVPSWDNSVADLKDAIEQAYAINAEHIMLTYNAEELVDTTKLSYYKNAYYLSDDTTLDVSYSDHYGGTANCHQGAVCSACNEVYTGVRKTNHDGKEEVRDKKNATCTEEGYTGDTYCLGCSRKISVGEVIAPKGHAKKKTDKFVKTEATCTALAEYYYECSTCNKQLDEFYEVPDSMKEHVKEKSNKIIKSEGDCKTPAEYYYECKDCHCKLTETYTGDNAAHTLENRTVLATTKNDGLMKKTCSKCGEVTEEIIIPKAYITIEETAKYTGKKINQKVTVTDAEGNPISEEYYKVTYKNNKKCGKATAIVSFDGQYGGEDKVYFSIAKKNRIPAKVSKIKVKGIKKGIQISWKKLSKRCTGYEIQYSTDPLFLNDVHKVGVKKKSIAKKKITKLDGKTTYYVRVRACNKISKSVTAYSAWTKVKTIQTK